MHGTETAAPNLLLDDILIDAMDGGAVIIVAATILRFGVQRLLDAFRPRRRSSVVSDWALVRGSGSSTSESQLEGSITCQCGDLQVFDGWRPVFVFVGYIDADTVVRVWWLLQ